MYKMDICQRDKLQIKQTMKNKNWIKTNKVKNIRDMDCCPSKHARMFTFRFLAHMTCIPSPSDTSTLSMGLLHLCPVRGHHERVHVIQHLCLRGGSAGADVTHHGAVERQQGDFWRHRPRSEPLRQKRVGTDDVTGQRPGHPSPWHRDGRQHHGHGGSGHGCVSWRHLFGVWRHWSQNLSANLSVYS